MTEKNYEHHKGIIVNSSYELINDSPKISLFGRLENGKSFKTTHDFEPYFFICERDLKKASGIVPIRSEKTTFKNFQNDVVVKVILKIPNEVNVLRRLFEENDIACYEADIPFTRRFLIDKKIQTTIEIKGNFVKGSFVDCEFENPELKSIDHNDIKNNLKLLSIDIETNPTATKLLAISFYGEGLEKVFVLENSAFKKLKIKNCFVFETEKKLLESFFAEVKEYDPDIITGWNFIDFDLKVLSELSKKYNVKFNLGRDDDLSNLRIESSFLKDSKANAHGRVILDGIHLMKISFIDLENYKLNTAAKELLGETKVSTLDDRTEFIQDSYENHPEIFFKYSLKDSELVYNILIKSNVYDLTVQRSMLTGMHLDSVSASIASFDSIYLPKLHEFGFVANSVYISESDQGLGGFVMTSKPGIYNNLLVLDFKSLYPSLIRTFNIDPREYLDFNEDLAYDAGKKPKNIIKYEDKNKFIIAPNGTILRTGEGILPLIIKKLWAEREIARKKKNELSRNAIKLLMNSMYGVLASPKSRYFNRYLSNSITYFAQFFIQLVMKRIEDEGYEVIYGDTDSTFVNTKTKDTQKAVKIGEKIEKDINEYLKKYIQENYHRTSELELEFEKTFVRFFMPTVRGSEAGAKKRYAGLRLLEDGTTKVEFTGLEFVRKDWTKVAKEFQLKLLDLVFHDEPVDQFICKFVNELQKGKYDDLLIYKKSLSKQLDNYTKTTPPHVKAARLLDDVKSGVIEYLMTEDGPQPIQKLTSKVDYTHYIEKQIKPIANSVLQVLGKDFDDVIKGNKQTGLGKFF